MEPPARISCSGNCLVHLHSAAGEAWLKRHSCPFQQRQGPDGISYYLVALGNNEPRFHSAQEIHTFHFQSNIADVERRQGFRVQNIIAVIPASTNPSEHQSQLSAAAASVGVRIVKLVDRSVLAATSYRPLSTSGRRTVLVFELGGKFLEISLLTTEDQGLNILAAVSDLGCPLLNHMISVVPRRFGIGYTFDAGLLRLIRTECERAKDALCLGSTTTVEFKIQRLGMEWRTSIDREWVVQLNLSHIRRGITRCLTVAEVRQEAVDEVVLAGASTNMPEVRSVLLEFFQSQRFRCSIDPANLIHWSSMHYTDVVSNSLNIRPLVCLQFFNLGLHSL